MSQYLNLVFNFINCVLICVLFNVSFCNNHSLENLLFNDSSLQVFDVLDSNSSLTNQNEISIRNKTSLNYSNELQYYSPDLCLKESECKRSEKCCLYSSTGKQICIKKQFGENCKGYFMQDCYLNLETDQCEIILGLSCQPILSKIDENDKFMGKCKCDSGKIFDYSPTVVKCIKNESYDPGTAMQIYKITMIFASCCLALILIIFLVCILRKSYCAPRRRVVPLDNTTIPDIFTLFPHVGNYDGGPLADGTLPPFEKPPTYDETLTLIRNEIGIPPPAYRTGNTPNSTNPSTPEMSSRFLITNPSLFTVNNHAISSSRTSSDSNLASDESIAGPSGSGTSRHQGIDNPAFC